MSAPPVTTLVAEAVTATAARSPRRDGRFLVGTALSILVIGIAAFGSFLAPNSPTALVGIPFDGPSPGLPLGTDYLGHDVLSRVLAGGWRILLVAALATALAYVIGLAMGLVAAFNPGKVDAVIMRGVDGLLAFPPLLLLLVLAAGLAGGLQTLIVGVVVMHIPSIARVIRTAALEVATHGFVEAALARGDSTWSILRREVLPNISHVVVTDGGPRLTGSIFLIAGLNYLGLGVPPGAPDWATMITENRSGLTIAPLGVVVPAIMIALLTVAVNLVADSLVDERGRARS